MTKLTKAWLILFGTLIALTIGTFLLVDVEMNGMFTRSSYTKQDMINHYEKNEEAIQGVKKFIDAKVNSGEYLEIEFKNKTIDFLSFKFDGMDYGYEYRDLDLNSNEANTALKTMNWTSNDLTLLKDKLDKAGCILVSSGNPTSIGWARKGIIVYMYNIHNKNLSNDLINEYNDDCTYHFYRDNIVLEHKQEVPNPLCFPE